MWPLPLYPTTPKAPVESVPPRARDTRCTRCTLSRDAPVVCAGADGTHYRGPGAVMVVTGAPMRRDAFALPVPGAPRDAEAALSPAPLSAPGVVAVRRLILDAAARQQGTTPEAANVVFDWAMRCPVPRGAGTAKDREAYAKAITACRPYLTNSIQTLRPSRILVLGPVASAAVLGPDAPLPINARRGWGWLAQKPGQAPTGGAARPPTTQHATPVLLLEDALVALATPSLRDEYMTDLAWALAATPPPPPWSAVAQECSTPEDTAAALDLLRRCAWVSLDLETNGGELWHPSLRLTSLALTPGPFRPDAVPPEDHPAFAGLPSAVVRAALADVDRPGAVEPPGSRAALAFVWSGASTPYQPSEQRAADFPAVLAFLRDPAVGKVGANVKFDLNVLRTLFGDAGAVRNVVLDTRLVGRLVDSESAADLATMGWLVGCGGHKAEAQHALAGAVRALKSRDKAAAKVLPGQLGLFGGPPAPATTPAPAPTGNAPGERAQAADAPAPTAGTPTAPEGADAPTEAPTPAPYDPKDAEDTGAEGPATFDAATALYDPAIGPRPVTGLQPAEDDPGAAIPEGQATKSAAYALLSGPVLRAYNARDTVTTARLGARLAGILKRRENLGFIWHDVERAATETFARVEARGYPVDIAGLRAAAAKVGAMQAGHREAIARLAPGVNPASTEQVARFLYRDLGLTPTEHTEKGAPATTRSALKALADKHPVVPHLSSLSELSHLRSIYLDGDPPPGSAGVGGLLKRVRADGRVHTRYDLAGARTGRLSCVEGSTLVHTRQGPVRIDALTVGHEVLTHLGTYERPSRVFPKGYEDAVVLRAGGHSVVTSRAHRVYTPEGWRPVGALRPGECIRGEASTGGGAASFMWHAVQAVEDRGTALLWDMTVPGAASYVAAGLAHHNSGDPNLQNIPRAESELGRIIKDCFVSPPGYVWVQTDFGQLELRVAAWLAGDSVMAGLFASGEDFHLKTGELVARVAFGISTPAWHALPAKERKRFRSYSKAVAFGLLYGKSTPSLARDLGISVEQAESIVAAVLGQFTDLARWSAQALEDTNRTGLAPTWWRGRLARERRVHRMDYRGTVAVNSRVQGTGSTFCLASCVAVDDWLRADGLPATLVGTVHDSLHILAREDVVDEVVHGTAAIMEGWAPDAPIRFVVDAETGQRLGSLDGYTIRRTASGAVDF